MDNCCSLSTKANVSLLIVNLSILKELKLLYMLQKPYLRNL